MEKDSEYFLGSVQFCFGLYVTIWILKKKKEYLLCCIDIIQWGPGPRPADTVAVLE